MQHQAPTRGAPPESERSNRIASFILWTSVAAAPLPFGSIDPPVVALWCIALGVALAFASPRALRHAQLAYLLAFALVVFALAFVLNEQLARSPWTAASPHPIWRRTADLLGIAIEPSVSIARHQPFFALGAPLAAMLSLACGYLVCGERARAHQLLAVIAWSGLAYALIGIASFVIDPTKTFWREKVAYASSLTTPFLHRNTAALYFGSCAIVCSLLFWQNLRAQRADGMWSWFRVDEPRQLVRPALMFLCCLAALSLTASRAGMVLSLGGLVTAFTLYFWRRLPRRAGPVAALVVGGAIALVFLHTLAGGVASRFEAHGLGDPARLDTYRASMDMIADRPWLGTGLGTFVWTFPQYRYDTTSMWGIWDKAHNTLLEIAAEAGLPLMLVVLAGWLVILGVLIHGVCVRRRDVAVPVAALSVALVSLAHSLIDFSLQIPGYAIPVFALVGAGLAQSFPTRRNSRLASNEPD